MSIQIVLSGNIVEQDTVTNAIAASTPVAVTSVVGTTVTRTSVLTISTTPVSLTLPVSPIQFLYIRNTHLTNTVSVTWTPTGGASNVIQLLEPGSFISFGQAAAGAGVTAVSVTGSGAGTTLEYVLAG